MSNRKSAVRVWRSRLTLLWFCAAVGWFAGGAFGQGPPDSFFRDGVPDFDQLKAGRAGGGNNHCAPTAAANSFTWFDDHGYNVVPNAMRDGAGGSHDDLIDALATYAHTSGTQGTTRDDFVKGLRRYLRSPNNQSGHQFDVKFQGSGFNGYTVGSQGDTLGLDWLKSEISSGEDVMLHIGWYYEDPANPGTFTAAGRRGGHVVTLDGYTSDGKLLVRDPFYPEGIIEPDASFAGGGSLVYEYSTAGNGTLRAVIEAATSVSPKVNVFDGLVTSQDGHVPVQNHTPSLESAYANVYGDYVSLAMDQVGITNPIGSGQEGKVSVIDRATGRGYRVGFDNDPANDPPTVPVELVQLSLVGGNPVIVSSGAFDNTDLWFQIASQFGTSPAGTNPHSQVELFVDREVFGDLSGDSFFDVFFELATMSPDVLDSFTFLLGPQRTTLDPAPWTIDPDFPPSLFYPLANGTDDVAARQAAINSIVPEPGSFGLLAMAAAVVLTLRRWPGRRRA